MKANRNDEKWETNTPSDLGEYLQNTCYVHYFDFD
jgi:hypothetical protein